MTRSHSPSSPHPASHPSHPSIHLFEFYSGIGGWHQAFKFLLHYCSKIHNEHHLWPHNFTVQRAFDINANANRVYRWNHPNVPIESTNIEHLKVDYFEKLMSQCVDSNPKSKPPNSPASPEPTSTKHTHPRPLIIWSCSPPCQPFTKGGRQEDINDTRSNSFAHLLTNILPKLIRKPDVIMVENVKNFETSKMRIFLLKTLKEAGYDAVEEFLMSPHDLLKWPNERMRYYLIAHLGSNSSSSSDGVPSSCQERQQGQTLPSSNNTSSPLQEQQQSPLPPSSNNTSSPHHQQQQSPLPPSSHHHQQESSSNCIPNFAHHKTFFDTDPHGIQQLSAHLSEELKLHFDAMQQYQQQGTSSSDTILQFPPQHIGDILVSEKAINESQESLQITDQFLSKFSQRKYNFDIIHPESSTSACFTKGYGCPPSKYVKGSGSLLATQNTKLLLQHPPSDSISNTKSERYISDYNTLKAVCPRRFHPREVTRLLGFPDSFHFPLELVNQRQQFKLLGNSIHMQMVSVLILRGLLLKT